MFCSKPEAYRNITGDRAKWATHIWKVRVQFFPCGGMSNQITVSIEYTEICHVHKAILDKLDIKKLMQEFVRKDNCQSPFGNILTLC